MAQFKKPSKKATIITAAIIVILLIIAATGTVVFLRDRGQTEAFEANQVGTQSAEGTQNEEQVATGEEQTTPEQPEGTEGEVATEGEEGTDVAGTTEGTANEGTTTGTATTGTRPAGTTTATEEIEESTITRTETVEIPERKVSEGHEVWWEPMSITAAIASANINPADDSIVDVEKTGDETVIQGEAINYSITVTNKTAEKLEGIEVKDELDDENLDLSTIEFKTEPVGRYGNGNVIKWNVDIEANSSVTIEFSINVKTSVEPGTEITNEAIANGEVSKEVAITEVEQATTDFTAEKDFANMESDAAQANKLTGVMVTLKPTGTQQELNEGNNWSYTFENLPVYDEDGNKINYEVEESAKAGEETKFGYYDQAIVGGVITNTFNPSKVHETTTFTAEKDFANMESAAAQANRLTGVIVTLKPTGTQQELNDGNDWTYTFENLPVYDENGNKINYEVEESAKAGEETKFGYYDQAIVGGKITNTFNPSNVDEKTEISVSKQIVAGDSDAAKAYPISGVIVTLQPGGETRTLNLENGYKDKFTNLDKYDENGNLINYTVQESAIEGEDKAFSHYTQQQTTKGNFVNTFDVTTVQDEKTSIDVSKTWNGIDSAAAQAHKVTGITVTLNGAEKEPITLNEENNWKGEFTDLPVYDKDGNKIVYTLSEKATVESEQATLDKYYTSSQPTQGQFVNTFNPSSVDDTVTVSGTKTWNDANNVDGARPTEVRVTLMKVMANGQQAVVSGVEPKTVNESTGWRYEFTNLPKYDAEGKEIQYTVMENEVPKYTPNTTIDENNKYIVNIENTREVEHIEATKTVSGVKPADSQTGDFTAIDPDVYGVKIGDTVKYTIVVRNNGNTDLEDFKIFDDKKVTLVSISAPGMDTSKVELRVYEANTNLVEGLTGKLAAGEEIRLEVTYLVENNADIQNKTQLTNKVTAFAGDSNIEEPEETIQITRIPRAEIEKTSVKVNDRKITDADRKDEVADVKVNVGDVITYDIVVRNTGNTTLNNVKVTDNKKVTFVDGERELLGNNGITLEPGETKTVTVSYKVTAADINDNNDLVENIATVTGKDNEGKDIPKDEDNDLVTEAEIDPNITVVKGSNKEGETLEYNDEIKYTITATNNSAKDGTVKVVDSKLKEAINSGYVSTPTRITVNENTTLGGDTSRNVSVDELANGVDVKVAGKDSATITFTVKVTAKPGTDIMNSITVLEGGNPGDKTEVTNDVEKTITTNAYSQQIKAKNIVLVLDLSSSMDEKVKVFKGYDRWGNPQYVNGKETKLQAAKEAIRDFVENIYAEGNGKDVKIKVVTFNWANVDEFKDYYDDPWSPWRDEGEEEFNSLSQAERDVVGTKEYASIDSSNYQAQLNRIDGIVVKSGSGMATDITAGINKAKEVLGTFGNNNENVVVFLGDGSPSSNELYGEAIDTTNSANNAATSLKRSATLYTIGFGIEQDGTAQNLLRDMASTNEETKEKLYYTASNKEDLINSFDAITSEASKIPDVDYEQSKDGVVTIQLGKELAADQKVTVKVNGRPTEYSYDQLSRAGITYNSQAKTLTWDITGYDAGAELTISYVLAK